MKKFKKMLTIALFVALIMMMIFSTFSMASFLETNVSGWNEGDGGATNRAAGNIIGMVVATIKVVAVAVAFIMLLAVAIKYMTAAPEEKANIKKSSFQYIVGAVIIFAATGLLSIIQAFSNNVKGS